MNFKIFSNSMCVLMPLSQHALSHVCLQDFQINLDRYMYFQTYWVMYWLGKKKNAQEVQTKFKLEPDLNCRFSSRFREIALWTELNQTFPPLPVVMLKSNGKRNVKSCFLAQLPEVLERKKKINWVYDKVWLDKATVCYYRLPW